jgi:hypothetical protein
MHAHAFFKAYATASGGHGNGRQCGQKSVLAHWIPPKSSTRPEPRIKREQRGYLGALSTERNGRIEKIVKTGPSGTVSESRLIAKIAVLAAAARSVDLRHGPSGGRLNGGWLLLQG